MSSTEARGEGIDVAGDAGGGQDWWGLLYLFFAGLVTVAVDMVRRLSIRLEKLLNDPEELFGSHHYHRRCDDCEDHPHRRKDDPEYDESEDHA